ncbi:MAG TPA: hypothetical protein VH437_09515 [Terriglobales bacterium]|jgi:hypothetical protein
MKGKRITVILALYFVGVTMSFGQSPFMGTWKLNEAKSKFAPGMPKNSTVIYATEGVDMKVTVDGTDNAGNATHNEWTGKFDGKDYPVTGDPTSDSRAYKRKGIHELDFTAKKGMTVTTSGRIVVSDDGKTRTVTSRGTDSHGKKFKGTAVYDLQ